MAYKLLVSQNWAKSFPALRPTVEAPHEIPFLRHIDRLSGHVYAPYEFARPVTNNEHNRFSVGSVGHGLCGGWIRSNGGLVRFKGILKKLVIVIRQWKEILLLNLEYFLKNIFRNDRPVPIRSGSPPNLV